MIFRAALPAEILPLRARVLRAGKPVESAVFAEDGLVSTVHFGAFSNSGCEACLTLFPALWKGQPAWQLRGMAVSDERRGTGAGKTLLEFSLDYIRKKEVASIVWCNARQAAAGFYSRQGWQEDGELFEVAGIGPHIKMWRHL